MIKKMIGFFVVHFIFFLFSPFNAYAASELLGDFNLEAAKLQIEIGNPSFSQDSLILYNSEVNFSWSLEPDLATFFSFGSVAYRQSPVWFKPVSSEQGFTVLQAYLSYKTKYLGMSAGLLPIPFGVESVLGYSENQKLPRMVYKMGLWSKQDKGIKLFWNTKPFAVDFVLHSGESYLFENTDYSAVNNSNPQYDNQTWVSTRFSYHKPDQWGAQLTMSTGNTGPESTQQPALRIEGLPFKSELKSKIRMGALTFFKIENLKEIYFELGGGDFLQQLDAATSGGGQNYGAFQWAHIEGLWFVSDNDFIVARVEGLRPNQNSFEHDKTQALLGFGQKQKYNQASWQIVLGQSNFGLNKELENSIWLLLSIGTSVAH